MSGRRWTSGCTWGLVAALLLAAGAPAAAEALKLGFSMSLTVGTDDYGKAALNGFNLARKEYNAKGATR